MKKECLWIKRKELETVVSLYFVVFCVVQLEDRD